MCQLIDAESENATDILVNWLIGDGDQIREHRDNLFSQ